VVSKSAPLLSRFGDLERYSFSHGSWHNANCDTICAVAAFAQESGIISNVSLDELKINSQYAFDGYIQYYGRG
jgi:hypothetical protein